MEAAVQTVVKVFVKSAKSKESLREKEFQSLVESQLKNILTDTDSSEAVKEMRKKLDDNQDGKVSFEEYMKLVGYLAVSLSDQHTLSKAEPAQTAAAAPVQEGNPAPEKEEEKPEAEAKPEALEAKPEEVAEGETQPEAAKAEEEEEKPAAAAKEVKQEEKVDEAEKVEEEKPTAAAVEEGEKKTDEPTS